MSQKELDPPGARLKVLRLEQNMTQEQLAKQIGTTKINVSRWERGEMVPGLYYRQRLCELFQKDVYELGFLNDPHAFPQEDPLARPSTSAKVSEELPAQLDGRALSSERVQDAKNHPFLSRRALMVAVVASAFTAGVVIGWKVFSRRNIPPAARATSPLIYTYSTHPPTSINDVAWSPSGTFIACANGDKTAQIVDATTGQARLTYSGHTGFVNMVSWSPDQQWVASASGDATVQIWNPLNGVWQSTYHGHRQAVWCAAWSPDGTRIASSGRDPAVQVWDALSGNLITTYRGHTKGVWMVAWSPDNQSLASCGEDGTIQVWNALTGQKSDTFVYQGDQNSTLYEVAWSPDGQRLASASANTTIQIWDALTGSFMLILQGHTGSVQTVKWSPDGNLLASGSMDKTVCIWDALTGKHIYTYSYHSDEVYAVSWAPNGQRLTSGSKDTTMQVYEKEM